MIQTIDILKDLIKIPSFVDSDNNEKVLIEYITAFIKQNTKFRYITQEVEGDRKNILVFNKKNPKICLFGHMDTVLPKTETNKPFEPVIEGDKLFGLGSVDMKAGLAIMLKLATEIESDDFSLVFSVDEEYDFKGALKLKEIKDFNPEFIINVEPTDNKILNGCRGITEFSLVVHGKSVHAGRKEFGINAIEKAVELVKILQEKLSEKNIEEGGKTTVNLAYLHGGMQREIENNSVEISGLGIVVPNYAKIVCEIRIANPVISTEYILMELTKIAESLEVKIDDFKTKFYLGAMLTPKAELIELENTILENGEVVEYGDISLAGYYEVQMLQEGWGGSSVVYGPGPISQSHMANEFVELSSIDKAESVLRSFVEKRIS